MAVVGIDIGDDNTYISVARLGGVDTIANEYSQRNTPSIVGLGGKQRFMGVSAENQRNLYIKNTVSYFKNFLGRSFKEEFVQKQLDSVGAEVVELKDGKLGFKVGDKSYVPEQILAMMLTKAKEIVVRDQGEDISNCVISVPVHFTQTQRHAVLDAAKIAGLASVQIMNDTTAMALAYGKTKNDLPEDDSPPRYIVLLDAGCSGVQGSLAAVTKSKAVILGNSSTTSTGGKFLDKALLDFVMTEVEAKHKCDVRNNPKAKNKLRLAVEKIKKQMSANSNKLPLQIENLVDEVDVNMSLERAQFEELIQGDLQEIRQMLNNLLDSTTVKKEQIHSVEIVGGSSRIPSIRNIIQEIFGVQPSYSLNADEAVSRGCGLRAATLSNKFRTKVFDIEDIVADAIEAVFTNQGNQEKLLIYDEGEKLSEERVINLKADLPLHLAVQYGENVDIANKFISLYQIGSEELKNAELELVFSMTQDGLVKLGRAFLTSRDEKTKRRKTRDSTPTQAVDDMETGGDGNDVTTTPPVEITFTETALGGLPTEVINHLVDEEKKMINNDAQEVSRQEAKNVLEENLYKFRAEVLENGELLEDEENTQKLKQYFDEMENWLYEEGEDAPEEAYKENLKCLQEQVQYYKSWKTKFLQQKAMEEERRRYLEQQEQQRRPHSANPNSQQRSSRQIPVVYEGVGPYTHTQHRPQSTPRDPSGYPANPQTRDTRDPTGYPANHQSRDTRDPTGYPANHQTRDSTPGHYDTRAGSPGFFSQHQARPGRDFRRQMMEDPFFNRSSFSGGPLFGYGW